MQHLQSYEVSNFNKFVCEKDTFFKSSQIFFQSEVCKLIALYSDSNNFS